MKLDIYRLTNCFSAALSRLSVGRDLRLLRNSRAATFALVTVPCLWLPLASASAAVATPPPARERLTLNADWRFVKGDPTNSETKLDYATLKPVLIQTGVEFTTNWPSTNRSDANPGADVPYTQPGFDDSAWRKLNLPHDWGIEGPFNQDYPGETGKLPWWGVAWYRKHFTIPASDEGKQFYLDIDGAMSYASVWLNGQFIGGWPYGYASWRLDLTPHINPGADNVLAIRLDNPPDSSRWYPGGGIYRNVWLIKTAPVHVGHWGTFVSTPSVNKNVASVNLQVSLDNRSTTDADLNLVTEFYELGSRGQKAGRPVASIPRSGLRVPAGGSATTNLATVINNPRLWSLKSPSRYVAVTSIEQGGDIVDVYETPFGVRFLQFTGDNGFFLNGERVGLNGVCDHHDLGALGAALNTRALERQLEILQEMGCNAIRTSHNPPAPELLDLCDRMGFVVMDESFDCWLRGKKHNDYHLLFPDWHEKDLRALVRRDRNHPCVILWSIGNEIGEQGSGPGAKLSAELAAIVRDEDRSRPVTAACDNIAAGFNGFQKTLDVFGYNYKPEQYGKFRNANPDMPLFGSETASTVSSRGEYFFPVATNKAEGRSDFQVSAYDLYAPRWATLPDAEFRGQDQCPFVAGEFVWTGFDYLGEPTPYNGDASNLLNFTDPKERAEAEKELKALGKIRVPSRSSYFGIIDLAGFRKDRFYLYQARWRPDLPMTHIVPHWTWPERVGKVTPVFVYTSADEAELFVNGRSQGKKKRGPYDYRLRWDKVVYEPGELKVVALRHHGLWNQVTVHTAGAPAKISLLPDRSSIDADGQDLSFVTVAVTDAAGRLAPRANNHISFQLTGPGEIIATDNGDPTSFEPFQAREHSAFNGLCLVIVRSTPQAGTMVLKATGPGLAPAELKLKSKP